ncbi:hypothetical protein [Aurantimonas sp. VKM B-3413]|uniref:hypothetical protein n=1 Tax=Aurantimonas sp. VKM B-3413 TaxID=2779401 RepID=UPI001E471D5B|nr:hypothetical protein [Aurantimonas sp. VKM B-3413]MCB8839347.1 hypothetical protein [Aurantimonas sp. VKM B-3413]
MNRLYLETASVVDISDGGIRIRRTHGGQLPPTLTAFDLTEKTFRFAKIAWARGRDAGLSFKGAAHRVSEDQIAAMLDQERVWLAESPATPVAVERRLSPRKRTRFRPAILLTVDRRPLEEVLIFDISDGGARLRRMSRQKLPPLVLMYDVTQQTARRVRIVWNRTVEIGVSFDSAPVSHTMAGSRLLSEPAPPLF